MTTFLQRAHPEYHRTHRLGWLRAAVLGANDGIISTASLVAGVAAAQVSQSGILATATAGLVAGAMSMAAGEYVSVHSQADAEKSDLAREQAELQENPEAEHRELTEIYMKRGLDQALAAQVATQLMQHDALGAHARDELEITETMSARPMQAVVASASSFAVGAALPLAVVAFSPAQNLLYWTVGTTVVFLALLGALAASIGGTPKLPSAIRVAFWGSLAMLVTAGVGAMFGAAP